MSNPPSNPELTAELTDLRARLAEAEQTLDAIRNGKVDGLVVNGPDGQRVFTLQGAQEPYRLLIEQRSEGALTLSREAVIFYTNQTFARMLQTPLGQVIGADLRTFLGPADQQILAGLIATAWDGSSRGEVSVRAADGSSVPVRLGLSRLQLDPELLLCVVATDLTKEKEREAAMRRLQTELETRVAERTTDLAASRLAALSMMEEATESARAFAEVNRNLQQEIRERERAEAEVRQVNAELEGQSLVLVGMVDTVKELFTKDHRAFCSATITDDVASLEVMVWTRTYEDTKELWKDGNFLRIEGKVKIREERVQFTCDAVEIYKPDDAPKPTRLLVEKGTANGLIHSNGKNGMVKNGEFNGKTAAVKNGNNGAPSAEPHKLILTMIESVDEAKDLEIYNKVIEIIKEYRGRDEVHLRIVNPDKVTNMKVNGLYTNVSPDLKKRLGQVVGVENIKTEKLG